MNIHASFDEIGGISSTFALARNFLIEKENKQK